MFDRQTNGVVLVLLAQNFSRCSKKPSQRIQVQLALIRRAGTSTRGPTPSLQFSVSLTGRKRRLCGPRGAGRSGDGVPCDQEPKSPAAQE
ncbi:unnamed protein product [Ixodes persulcatus]